MSQISQPNSNNFSAQSIPNDGCSHLNAYTYDLSSNSRTRLVRRTDKIHLFVTENPRVMNIKILEKHVFFVPNREQIVSPYIRKYFEAMSLLIADDLLPNDISPEERNRHEFSPLKGVEILEKLHTDPGNDSFAPLIEYLLGEIYRTSADGIQENIDLVLTYLRMAADSGHVLAQYTLGLIFLHGSHNIPANLTEARRLLKLSAHQNSAPAQCELADMIKSGKGGERNESEARNLYMLAANQNYAPAQHNLAIMYMTGNGTPKNVFQAIRLFNRAAQQGYEPSKTALENYQASLKQIPPKNTPPSLVSGINQLPTKSPAPHPIITPQHSLTAPLPKQIPATNTTTNLTVKTQLDQINETIQNQSRAQEVQIKLLTQKLSDAEKDRQEMQKKMQEMQSMIMRMQNSIMTLQNENLKRQANGSESEAKRTRIELSD